ncbi:HAMP domain-containing protein [Leptolyngbya sp. AN02str]|uniref:HAMP domain-containing protein n=1 Tax=Leptolyngbya sp. AN02str TaxID=3423363 RepID=UPI003D31B938
MLKPNNRLKDLVRLSRSRLSLKIVFWIFIFILTIATVLMVPSMGRYRQDLLTQQRDVSTGKVTWLLATYGSVTGKAFLQHASQLSQDAMMHDIILGGAMYDEAGASIGTFGEPPTMSFTEASQQAEVFLRAPQGDRYDVSWALPLTTGNYWLVLRHQGMALRPAMLFYTLRILGLVLIIAAFVTFMMMLMLGANLITPILRLRRDLTRAGHAFREGNLSPQFESTSKRQHDELGDVVLAFEGMVQQIGQAIAERNQAEAELRHNNEQLHQYLQQVEKVTAAAAAIEEGQFQPTCLTAIAERSDELGRLARVFQDMVIQVAAREAVLKQQITDLKIEIDQQKRVCEVAQISQSGYFRDIQEEINSLNLEEFWS